MIEINEKLVKSLIKQQFPQYAHLNVCAVEKSGHDNRTFHLGENMSVRLPSGKSYASQVEKENLWLPKLSLGISLPISSPIEKGHSCDEFPYPWSINKWLEGDTANTLNVSDLNSFAKDLGRFLKELQEVNAEGGPVAGKQNFYRGGNLGVYNLETQKALERLKGIFDTDKLGKLWNIALSSKYEDEPVWVHGDVAVGNLLVKNGKLCAVIDFGILGVGDPACDYVMAWTFFNKESRNVFLESVNCDKNTKDRAMGWALWKALITYDEANKTSESSNFAKETIEEILRDYSKQKA